MYLTNIICHQSGLVESLSSHLAGMSEIGGSLHAVSTWSNKDVKILRFNLLL